MKILHRIQYLKDYLHSLGWSRTKTLQDLGEIWYSKEFDAEVYMPSNTDVPDFSTRLRETLNIISTIYSIDAESVLDELFLENTDVFSIRVVSSDTEDGTIGLERGADLVKDAYSLFTAAALAVEKPKLVYAGSYPQPVSEFMKQLRLGQTQKGSYIVTLCNSLPETAQSSLTPKNAEGLFERKVSEKLVEAVSYLHSQIKGQGGLPEYSSFLNAAGYGVSANLCDALSKLNLNKDDDLVELRVHWAPKYERPIETGIGDVFSFNNLEAKVLGEIAAYLRDTLPVDDVLLKGSVMRLERQSSNSHEVTILVHEGDYRTKRVHMLLEETSHSEAIRAYEVDQTVQCKGTLRKDGRIYWLSDVKEFNLLEDEQ